MFSVALAVLSHILARRSCAQLGEHDLDPAVSGRPVLWSSDFPHPEVSGRDRLINSFYVVILVAILQLDRIDL